jgi:transcriptional regulator with XRE-family HTH domain
VRGYSASVRLPSSRLQYHRGRAVRYFREERGLTQAALARLAHVGVATVTRLETRGARDSRVLLRVCRAMMTTPAELDAWIAERHVDHRLGPLLLWFANLSPRHQDACGELLRLLLPP